MDGQKKTRRERIVAALDAMGAAVETAGFFITSSVTGGVSVQFYDGRAVFDAIAARPGAKVTFQRMGGNNSDTFRCSSVISDVEFFQFLPADEAAHYGIS